MPLAHLLSLEQPLPRTGVDRHKGFGPLPPFYFGLKTVSCSPSWLQTCYVAKADFKQLIILLPLPNASKILGMHHLISLRASLLGEWTTRLNHFHYKM